MAHTPINSTGLSLRASSTIGVAGTTSAVLDLSGKWQAGVQSKIVYSATVSASNGVITEVFGGYGGSTTTFSTVATFSFQTSSGSSGSTHITPVILVPNGFWQVRWTNRDAANDVTLESLYWTMDSISS